MIARRQCLRQHGVIFLVACFCWLSSCSTDLAGTLQDTTRKIASVRQSRPSLIRVYSQNLRCLVDNWNARLPLLVEAIAIANPDIIGVQEACSGEDHDNVNELVTQLEARTGRTYAIIRTITHRSWDQRFDEGIAVISAHPIQHHQVIDLPKGLFPRRAILTRIESPVGQVVFSATHLEHLSGEVRGWQARALTYATHAFARQEEPVIVAGDFNEDPGSNPRGGVSDAFWQAGFMDVWSSLRPGETGFTFPAVWPTNRIDQVWFKASSSVHAGHIDLWLIYPTNDVWGSDHRGLYTEFVLQ